MMDYLSILLSDISTTAGFLAQKEYQKRRGSSMAESLKYSMLLGAISAVLFLVISGFTVECSAYSLVMAFLKTVFATAYLLISFVILKKGTLAMYTVFLMSGGMILPYIYGIAFLGEELTILRTVGIAVITAALVIMNAQNGKKQGREIFLCIAVFVLNGLVSITSKVHQIDVRAINTNDFIFWSSLIRALVCLPLFLVFKNKCKVVSAENKKPILLIITVASVMTTLGFLFQLYGAINVPAGVLFPLITGGNVILSALAGRIFFKEKLSKRQIIAIGVCAVGTCMFL